MLLKYCSFLIHFLLCVYFGLYTYRERVNSERIRGNAFEIPKSFPVTKFLVLQDRGPRVGKNWAENLYAHWDWYACVRFRLCKAYLIFGDNIQALGNGISLLAYKHIPNPGNHPFGKIRILKYVRVSCFSHKYQ